MGEVTSSPCFHIKQTKTNNMSQPKTEAKLQKEIEELSEQIQKHNSIMVNSKMDSNHEALLLEYNRLANKERLIRTQLTQTIEIKKKFLEIIDKTKLIEDGKYPYSNDYIREWKELVKHQVEKL